MSEPSNVLQLRPKLGHSVCSYGNWEMVCHQWSFCSWLTTGVIFSTKPKVNESLTRSRMLRKLGLKRCHRSARIPIPITLPRCIDKAQRDPNSSSLILCLLVWSGARWVLCRNESMLVKMIQFIAPCLKQLGLPPPQEVYMEIKCNDATIRGMAFPLVLTMDEITRRNWSVW
jgi:hypothetical protein